MKPPNCKIKAGLPEEYKNRAKSYSNAVAELARNIGTVSKADYDNLNLQTQKARRVAARAMEALDAHTDEHGC